MTQSPPRVGRPPESQAPSAPTDGGLRLDPARGTTRDAESGGPGVWLVAALVAAAAGLLLALRRRLPWPRR